MAFIPQDLYLTSGLVGSINNWQESVTKFDSSTFYNWEQDNLPIYDLEDRTDYIWERIGYPIEDGFSGIPGKMFVVSANYQFPVGKDSSGIVFRNLSSVINTLPNPITYPIIIEVASFGNLGELNLNNIKIDDSCPGAGLEIVNRAFARSKFGPAATPSAIYISADPSVSSVMIKDMFHSASAMALSAAVLSATTGDSRLNNNNRSWIVNFPYGSQSSPVTINSLLSQKPIFSYKDTSFDQNIAVNKFAIQEYGATEDLTITANDISITNNILGTTINRPAMLNQSNVAVLSYGNYLSNVKISNCDGPIYVRNFIVDGGLDTTGLGLVHSTETGYNIVNSDIVLENCMAVRCSKHGFKIINSTVDVRRAIVGARIYDVSTGGQARTTNTNGIGLYAENSLINFVPVSTAYVQYSGVDFISQFAFNDVGIELNNSKIMGGNSITSIFTPASGPTMIQSMYNTKTGVVLNNSILDHKGGLEVFNNSYGIIANNSQLNLPLLTVEYNQNIGMQAYNCDVKLNPELIKPAVGNSYRNTVTGAYKQFNFQLNSQHLLLDHSNLRYPDSSSLPTRIGNIEARYGFGTYSVGATRGHLPAIEVRNNSNAELVHTEIKTYQTNDSDFVQPGFGTAISVHDGSKVCFKASIGDGTTFGPTILTGPASLVAQKGSAVAWVSKNSQIEFNGNTLITQGGVDVLAEENSVINFNPHRKIGKNVNTSGWNLDNAANHTRVELHATRACLVVDNNSILNIEDIGSYAAYWPGALLGANDYDITTLENGPYTSAGYFQFYPNPEDDNILVGAYVIPAGSYTYTNTVPGYFLTDYTNANSETAIGAFSKGGVCVKAQRGSKVNAINVNFAAGWYNTSGHFFDTSSGNCELLRIWNICQGSELEAAYLSVSSTYPSLTGYYGPSAVYLSGAGVPASGAPSSTPNTSSLSVLDFYGASGTRAAANYGPFRLYFSPHTQAKMLGYVSGTGAGGAAYYGAPYQMLAQGYNPSGNLIGSSAFDAIYSGISTSAFYYVSAMLDPGYRNRVRLDESAADTFANARHNALGRSGRIPLVTIYRSLTTPGGQQYDADLAGYGKGFKSAELFDLRRYS